MRAPASYSDERSQPARVPDRIRRSHSAQMGNSACTLAALKNREAIAGHLATARSR